MKKLLPAFLLVFSFTMVRVVAQTATEAATTEEETNCYLKWAKQFEDRGGYEVHDSTYSDVIVSFRRGTKADCFAGKVQILKGKIVKIWLKQEGNSYELLERKYKITNEMTVVNGVSTTLVTNDDELVNVIFYRRLKPKKKGLVKAPDPVMD